MSPVPDAPDPSIPQAFEVLGEHYRLVEKLGEGGFGVVYRAHHDLLEQEFAVKILKPELCEDTDVRNRFLDEARALIRFSHDNVVQLRHVGEHEGRLYLVMDLVRGEALNDVLGREGALDEERAVNIILQVLGGLEAAHAAGIVHRDLKPSNLIVESRPDGSERVRILDFGLSKLSSVDGMQSAHRSVTGSIIGTLAYMSPEQLAGKKEIDARADVFASGIVLQEMLDGHHPYPGESGIVVAAKLLRDPVPPLEAKRAKDISESTCAALSQSLERDRDARFASAFAFSQALTGQGPPSDTSRVTTIQQAKEELARRESQAARAKAETKAKRTKTLAVVGGLVAVLAAVGIFLATREGPGGEPAPKASLAKGGATPASPPVTEPDPVPAPDPPPSVPAAPVTPEPAAPVTPEPAAPDPAPEPAVPEPAPVTPEPAAPEPITPEPAAPGAPEPGAPPPGPPTDPIADATPGTAGTRAEALALTASGTWLAASGTWMKVRSSEWDDLDRHVEALRGANETWLTGADGLARRGDVDAAVQSLDKQIDWLTRIYKEEYEPRNRTDRANMMRPSGYALMYRGETWTEKARWLGVKGDVAGQRAALSEAESDLKLAWQSLNRDGVHYWEFLLRRAKLRDDLGQPQKALEDLAGTTKVNSAKVPPHMWIAHAVGLRRQAERSFRPGRRRGPGGRARPAGAQVQAARHAEGALKVAKDGVSWTRQRGEVFDRDQWLEVARVIVVNDMAREAGQDRTDLHGLLKWYLEQAKAQPKAAWESDEMARARLLPLEAAQALLEAKVAVRQGKNEDARTKMNDALAKAREGVALRERIAAEGGELPAPFPYIMLAWTMRGAGQDGKAVMQKGIQAARTNPE